MVIWRALGKEKAWALATYVPCIHWNRQCWETLRNKMVSALHKKLMWTYSEHFWNYIPVESDLTQEVKNELEKFIYLKYCPKGCSNYQCIWFKIVYVLQTTCGWQQVAIYTWCTRRAHKACIFTKLGMISSHCHTSTTFWAATIWLL